MFFFFLSLLSCFIYLYLSSLNDNLVYEPSAVLYKLASANLRTVLKNTYSQIF